MENLPDKSVTIESMKSYGYTAPDMYPLSKKRALDLIGHGATICMLYDDNSKSVAYEAEDIKLFSGMFGIERGEWEKIREKIPPEKAETAKGQKPSVLAKLRHFKELDRKEARERAERGA